MCFGTGQPRKKGASKDSASSALAGSTHAFLAFVMFFPVLLLFRRLMYLLESAANLSTELPAPVPVPISDKCPLLEVIAGL